MAGEGVDVLGFYTFLLFEKLLMLLPYALRKALFGALANLAWHIDKKHCRVIEQNLRFAFGDTLSETEKERIGRYCYRNLLLTLLQVIENHSRSKKSIAEKVTIEGREIVVRAKESGRPIIFVTAHFGNWELGGAALGSLVMPVTVVHNRLNNGYFDRYLHEARSRFGLSMVEKRGAVKHLAKTLKAGGAISLLTDQNTHQRDGIVVNFFGKTARNTAAPAFLARKYNAVIIPLYITTDDDNSYTVKFYDSIEVEKTDSAEADILKATQEQADLLEKAIRENPKFWFWCHRRWKTEHPEIYC